MSRAMIRTCMTFARSNSAQGRFYNMEDQVQRARVAVIGSEAKEKLFSGRNALGRAHPARRPELRSGRRA